MRNLIALLCLAALAVPSRGDVEPPDAALALPIALSDPADDDAHVDVPPSLFAHVRHGADEIRVVDAEGRWVAAHVLTRDGSGPGARESLEPLLVSQRASPTALSLLFDLRVRTAPGLALELDLRGPVGTPLLVTDADDPREGPWEEIPFVASETTDVRVVGRAAVPAGAGKRFVRVVVPTRAPSEVELRRAHATITRHRVHFRPRHGAAPFRLLAGFDEVPGPVGPEVSDPIPGWDLGAPARVEAPGWLPPLPGLGAPLGGEPAGGGRPFPWAESVATLLFLALTIWAVLLRKEG